MRRVFNISPGVCNVLFNKERAKYLFTNSKKKGIVFFHCWPYLDHPSLIKHQDKIRKIIVPKEEYYKESSKIIAEYKKRFNASYFVGVHIRRGDYKTFYEGRYYFDLDVYKKRMEEISEILSGRCCFIIFSDEDIDLNVIKNEVNYDLVKSNNSAVIDIILMSFCDYIIGPPSTFSGWSSFWGNVPKHIMINENQKIFGLDNFGVYMTQIMDDSEDEDGCKIITRVDTI